MNELVAPDRIQEWIPGNLTFHSGFHKNSGLEIRGYDYLELDVTIPQMRDYMIVTYEGSKALMRRRASGKHQQETVEGGVVSILTRAEQSQWAWDRPISVSHIYLSHEAINDVAGEIFECDIEDIEINDQVRAEDCILPQIAQMLKAELLKGAIGGSLLVESLRIQCCIHLLRNYAQTRFSEPPASGRFKACERRVILDFIRENTSRNITLSEMAAALNLSPFHFARKFKEEFGTPPHKFLMNDRLENAKELMSHSQKPLKVIAAQAGFSDQSHMTRSFQSSYGVTPSQYRRGLL